MTITDTPVTTGTQLLPTARTTAVLLLAAPALQVLESLLSPLGADSTATDMTAIARHEGAFVLSVLLGMAAVVLFVPAFLGLARGCVDASPRLARFAGWTAVASMLGFFGVRGIQAVQLSMAQHGLDPATAGTLVDGAGSSALGAVILVLFLGGTPVGTICLAVACWRAGLARPAAVLLAVFPVVDLALSGHAGTVVAHVVLLVALAWLGRGLKSLASV